MTAVIPQMKFSPDETPWARWVEAAIASMQADNELRKQNDGNVNTGMSATVDSIGRAVRYQQSLVTVSATGPGGVSSVVGTTTWSSGATLPLVLTRPSQVLLTISSSWLGLATVSSSGAATAIGRIIAQIDGSTFNSATGSVGTFNGSGNQINGSGELVITEVRSLAAGTHTLSAYGEGQIQGTSGMIQITGITVTASVIG